MQMNCCELVFGSRCFRNSRRAVQARLRLMLQGRWLTSPSCLGSALEHLQLRILRVAGCVAHKHACEVRKLPICSQL